MRFSAALAALLTVPLLTACVDDRVALEFDNTGQHFVALIREQPLVWNPTVNLSFVVARMPTCMRRHAIGPGSAATRVEVYQVPSGALIIKAGKRLFATETQTCEGWARMTEEPVEGMGKFLGTFRAKQGVLVFEKEEADPPPVGR